jgi:hypothetical protein
VGDRSFLEMRGSCASRVREIEGKDAAVKAAHGAESLTRIRAAGQLYCMACSLPFGGFVWAAPVGGTPFILQGVPPNEENDGNMVPAGKSAIA